MVLKIFSAEKTITVDEKQLIDNDTIKEEDKSSLEKSNEIPGPESSDHSPSSGEACEWLESEDDELIVVETGDGAPLVGTMETVESYYVVNPNQHSFNGLSPSGMM